MKNYWLLKSEPTSFSVDDLNTRPHKTEPWDGVRNYQARNFLQQMKVNDEAFFYHSNCKEPGIYGLLRISKEAYPDPSSYHIASPYYDSKSSPAHPRWYMVDVTLVKKFTHALLLQELRETSALKDLTLLQKGNRLSVMPIPASAFNIILSLL